MRTGKMDDAGKEIKKEKNMKNCNTMTFSLTLPHNFVRPQLLPLLQDFVILFVLVK
jgi:hypothetical protein